MDNRGTLDQYRPLLREKDDFNTLSNSAFANLTADLQVRKYPKGQVLFSQGDGRDRFYYVIDGVVRLERIDETGDFGYFNYVKPDKGFPYRGIFSATEYPYDAVAMTPLIIASFPMSDYEDAVRHCPATMARLVKLLGQIIDVTEDRLQRMVTSSARNRVMQALIIFGKELGVPSVATNIKIPYPITLIELARVSGTTRETAGQIVAQLVESGKIMYHRKMFTFDPNDLMSHGQ